MTNYNERVLTGDYWGKRASADVAHYVVEDTFRNTLWRFEISEEREIQAFLTEDHEERPSSFSVHLVGEIRNVTESFK